MCVCTFFAGFSAGFKRRTSTFCWPGWSSVTACECGGKRTVVAFLSLFKILWAEFFLWAEIFGGLRSLGVRAEGEKTVCACVCC